jgi:hypothetical protein
MTRLRSCWLLSRNYKPTTKNLRSSLYHKAGTGSLASDSACWSEFDCTGWAVPVASGSTVASGAWAVVWLAGAVLVVVGWLARRVLVLLSGWTCVASWGEVSSWFALRLRLPKGKRHPIAAPTRAATATTVIINPINLFISESKKNFCVCQSERIIKSNN